ncbi:uncharacterized protein [Musca autumnalis]|uniref:uncharacterized protein n=1 Tax=Musca autumnalis TaxID=221902 RepID=UPI003CED951F
MQCYAPTEPDDEEIKDDFYRELEGAIANTPKGDILMILGDFNAKVGNDNTNLQHIMGKHALPSDRNDNGKRLVELCANNDLFIGGTRFPHKRIHKYTWESPNGSTRNQIDHILISRRYHNSLLDVRTRRGADIFSDHNLLVAQIRLRPSAIESQRKRNTKLNIEGLENGEMRHNYVSCLNNELLKHNHPHTLEDVTHACRIAAEKTIGLKNREKKPWISPRTWEAIERRRALKKDLINTKKSAEKLTKKQQYTEAEKQVKQFAKEDKNNFINGVAADAEIFARRNNLRGVYTAIKQITNKMPNIPPLKDKNGLPLTTIEHQLTRWTEFYKDADDNSTVQYQPTEQSRNSPPHNINVAPPTNEEISSAISKLKSHKAAGPDNLPPELFKYAADVLTPILQPIVSEAWSTNNIPSKWKEGVIITIPKKGDLSSCGNWRGITLLNTIQKVLAFIILDRITPVLNPQLRREQNGFRPQRSCSDHINTLRIVVEQSVEFRSPLYLLFVDFERAFDNLNRDAIWDTLTEYGLPNKIIDIIRELYTNAECSVRFKQKTSPNFTIRNGVRQGCVLSPLLFILVLDNVLRKTNSEIEDGIQWRPHEKLSDLDYADDICFMSHSIAGTRAKLEQLLQNAKTIGLKINMKKTKLMRLETQNTSPLIVMVDSTPTVVDDVDSFCYLGSIITKDGGADTDVQSRINKARIAFHNMRKIWSSRNISRSTKLRLFNTSIKPILLYGCETWKVTKTINQALQVFINKCLRRICNIFWPTIISNADLLQLTSSEPIEREIKRRKWRWIGHTLRKDDTDLNKMAFEWNPQGTRRRGRPKMTWIRTIQAESKNFGTWPEIRRIAQDRQRWNELVSALCSV